MSSKLFIKSFGLALLALLAYLPSLAMADSATTTLSVYQRKLIEFYGKLSGEAVFISILLIGSGLLLTFFGAKFLRVCMGVAGFLLGMYVCVLVLDAPYSNGSLGSNADLILLLSALACGVIFALTFFCFFQIAIYALGAFGMISLTHYVLLVHLDIAANGWPKFIIIAAAGLIGVLLSFFLDTMIITISTAVIGSAAFIAGIDFYAKTGIVPLLRSVVFEGVSFSMQGDTWAMFGGFVVLALLGAFVQFRFFRDSLKESLGSAAKGSKSRTTYAYV